MGNEQRWARSFVIELHFKILDIDIDIDFEMRKKICSFLILILTEGKLNLDIDIDFEMIHRNVFFSFDIEINIFHLFQEYCY